MEEQAVAILAGVFAAVLSAGLVLLAFVRTDAAKLAGLVRSVGPLAVMGFGLAFLAAGAAAPGGILFAVGFGSAAMLRRRAPEARRRATIRTAALEMDFDHRSGALGGHVLAGTFEGKALARLHWPQLRRLYGELAIDPESRQLLEAYLDGRFPAWRKNTQPHVDRGHRVPPRPGPMTKQEAYEVLGLEAGAAPADVRKAHRRLLQRLHPDLGRPSVLAVRIDKAKDVLLSDHD